MGEQGGTPLAASELPALLERIHAALVERREEIDALNVFPVPDGDTGTNMTSTVLAGLEALPGADQRGSATDLGSQVVRGAVRGARGNSGVILSQILRALVEVVSAADEVDAGTFAVAWREADRLARDAVADPIEGTILTAVRAAADAASTALGAGLGLLESSAQVVAATSEAVAATREQLEVLRDADVVDAGARGFEVVIAAVHGHLTGTDAPVVRDRRPAPGPDADTDRRAGSLAYRYEVGYLLDAPDAAADGLRAQLEVLGDSVVVVAAGGLLNVHVHTDDVGGAIEEGVAVGRPSEIEVIHLGDQLASRRAATAPARVGVVAVLGGDGLAALARSAGAVVVEGAAGALPSVADVLNAVGEVRAERVVVLPGHRDVLATARAALEVAVAEGGRPLEIVAAATSAPAVLAALAVHDPDGEPDQVVRELTEAAESVRAGEVVAATHDARTPAGDVRAGAPLAVVDGEVVAVCDAPLDALEAVCTVLGARQAEMVTLLVGADVDADERGGARERIEALGLDGELEVITAGLRPARYAVGVA